MILETERLRLREATTDDADFALAVYNSPGFIEFVGDRGLRTPADAVAYIEERLIASYREHGLGLYVVELKDSGTPVGICGLVVRPGLDAPDIGFTFLPEHMRKGYGYESAAAVLAHARTTLGLPRILAITDPRNSNSIGLLTKLGMAFDGQTVLPGSDAPVNRYSTA
jgi:RimJ/RimL family protein N-acetyltransferase